MPMWGDAVEDDRVCTEAVTSFGEDVAKVLVDTLGGDLVGVWYSGRWHSAATLPARATLT
jgi:hypothetical protein